MGAYGTPRHWLRFFALIPLGLLSVLVARLWDCGDFFSWQSHLPESCARVLEAFVGFEDLARADVPMQAGSDAGATDEIVFAFSSQHDYFRLQLGTPYRSVIRSMIAGQHAAGPPQRPALFAFASPSALGANVHSREVAGASGAARVAFGEVSLRGWPAGRHLFPHGMAAHKNILAVVNHGPERDSVDFFRLLREAGSDSGLAAHFLGSLEDIAVMENVNDCAFAPAAQFFKDGGAKGGDGRCAAEGCDGAEEGEKFAIFCSNWRREATGSAADVADIALQRPSQFVFACGFTLSEQENISQRGPCRKLDTHLAMPNGVEVVGRTLFVVQSLGARTIVAYELGELGESAGGAGRADDAAEPDEGASHSFPFSRRVAVDWRPPADDEATLPRVRRRYELDVGKTHCDNLHYDPQSSSLYTGCHPQQIQFVKHSASPGDVHSPSHVVQVRFSHREPNGEKSADPDSDGGDSSKLAEQSFVAATTALLDAEGALLSGSSAAAPLRVPRSGGHGERVSLLLVGAVRDRGVLVCTGMSPRETSSLWEATLLSTTVKYLPAGYLWLCTLLILWPAWKRGSGPKAKQE